MCIQNQPDLFCLKMRIAFELFQTTKLSFKSVEQRFHMEEDTKGRGSENFPLSLNIIAAQEI